MQRDHYTIRQVSSYLVPVGVFGSHSFCTAVIFQNISYLVDREVFPAVQGIKSKEQGF